MHEQSRASGCRRMQMEDEDQQSGLGSGRHNTFGIITFTCNSLTYPASFLQESEHVAESLCH